MKKNFEAYEYQQKQLYDFNPTTKDQEFIKKISEYYDAFGKLQNRFKVEQIFGKVTLKANSWVGVVELSNSRIILKPKFHKSVPLLIDMVCFSENIPYMKESEGKANIGPSSFMEVFVRLFLREVKEVIKKGLYKEYISEEDSLGVIRGSINFSENFKNTLYKPTKIFCVYDELSTNVLENKVLLTVLTYSSRLQLSAQTKKDLNRIRYEFEHICEPYLDDNWPCFNYNRINAHYESVHRIAEYIFNGHSINDLFKYKDNSNYSLLINMNNLFEKFVIKLIERYLPKEYKVSVSPKVEDAVTSGGKNYTFIIPDIVVKNKFNSKITVFDAKYKEYGGKHVVHTDDIFQLHFYSQYYETNSEKPQSVIIFPTFSGNNLNKNLEILPKKKYNSLLQVKCINIAQIIGLEKEKNKSELEKLALNLIES